MRVGLTGGIGSGKSEAARFFAQAGAFIIDADELAREAVAQGTPAFAEIAVRWPQVIRSDGTLDRAALGKIIFEDDTERLRLNAIVHPCIRALGRVKEATARNDQVIIHVVPLLFETGFAEQCDHCIVVFAPEEQRIARVRARDQLDEAAVQARMARQIAPSEARRLADDVLENDGNLEYLKRQVDRVYAALVGAAA